MEGVIKKRARVGQRFRFIHETTAIAVHSPFGKDAFLGFQAPAEHAKKTFQTELLKEEITILTTNEFIVQRAYNSVTGWCVVGRRADQYTDVHFHQKLGSENEDTTENFLEIEILNPEEIYSTSQILRQMAIDFGFVSNDELIEIEREIASLYASQETEEHHELKWFDNQFKRHYEAGLKIVEMSECKSPLLQIGLLLVQAAVLYEIYWLNDCRESLYDIFTLLDNENKTNPSELIQQSLIRVGKFDRELISIVEHSR